MRKARFVDLILEILESILTLPGAHPLLSSSDPWELHPIQYGYASGILSILQSDGDKLHESDIAALKLEEIETQTVEKERSRR